MSQIALIDDDPVEALVVSGLLEHVAAGHTLTHFTTVEAFMTAPDADQYDLVLLDRRVPPHQTFTESLAMLADGPYAGPIVLMSAGPSDELRLSSRSPLTGPVDKADLLTPKALERLVETALASRRL